MQGRPYVPMTKDDVIGIQDAGRRAKALQVVIDESLKRNLVTSAGIARKELEQLRLQTYKAFDILI